jgi:hypothetical protein
MMLKTRAAALATRSQRGRRIVAFRPACWTILAGLVLVQSAGQAAWGQSQPTATQSELNQSDPTKADQPLPVGIAILNAKDYQPIPPGSGFDTVVQDPSNLDNSTLDNAILGRVNQELVARGYHVDHDAHMVMLVDGDLVRGTSKDAVVDKIKGIGGQQNDHQGNVFSTNGDTLLTQTVPDNHPNTFRINLSIYDRATGLYLWRGSMERGTSDLTPDKATEHMVPPLVGVIGQSEQNRHIAIGTTDQPQ